MDSWKFRYSIFSRTLKGGLNWEYVNRLGETIEIFLLFSFSWPVPFFLIFRDAKSGGKNMRLQMCTTDRWCPTVTLCCWCRGFPKSTCYALLIFLGQLAIFLFLHLKYEKKKKKVIDQNRLGIHYTNGSSPPMMPGHRLNMFLWEPIGPMRHDGWQKSK